VVTLAIPGSNQEAASFKAYERLSMVAGEFSARVSKKSRSGVHGHNQDLRASLNAVRAEPEYSILRQRQNCLEIEQNTGQAQRP
jgi:hypothetical protein